MITITDFQLFFNTTSTSFLTINTVLLIQVYKYNTSHQFLELLIKIMMKYGFIVFALDGNHKRFSGR